MLKTISKSNIFFRDYELIRNILYINLQISEKIIEFSEKF